LDGIRYLSVEDVIALHDDILVRMNDPFAPLLHPDKLESAVARCHNVAWYEGADLIRQAVVLAVAISQSQAFLEGNKRAAFAAADVFLRINGLAFHGPPLDMAYRMEAIAEADRGAARDAQIDRFEEWLRGQTVSDTSFQ
jgi:death on curing protein